jgi:hypothetical protein
MLSSWICEGVLLNIEFRLGILFFGGFVGGYHFRDEPAAITAFARKILYFENVARHLQAMKRCFSRVIQGKVLIFHQKEKH